jgi:hypothetical protein
MSQNDAYLKLAKGKRVLANLLGWPPFDNLSWYRLWPDGWCLHGRHSVTLGQGEQKSMNFKVPVTEHPLEALANAVKSVKINPQRLEEKVRWHCPEHGWEKVISRGEMLPGCPKCGVYYCEPWPRPEGKA